MPYFEATFVIGGFLAVLGTLAFAAAPHAALNRTFGALLVLRGGWFVCYELSNGAADPAQALALARVAKAYAVPSHFLTLHLLYLLFRPERPGRVLRGLVVANWAALAVCLALAALDPTMLVDAVERSADGLRTVWVNQWPYIPSSQLSDLTHALAVALAARAVASPAITAARRSQAAVVGMAFAVPLQWTSTRALLRAGTTWTDGNAGAIDWANLLPLATGFVVVAACLPRLVRSFEGRAHRLAAALVVLAGVSSLDLVAVRLWPSVEAAAPFAFFFWVAVQALGIALALIRYDLAGLTSATRRQVEAVAQFALVAAALVVPAVVTLALTHGSLEGIVLAGVFTLVAVAVAPSALAGAARLLARLLLPQPHDADAVAQRLHLYTLALAKYRAADGRIHEAPALAALRRDLGITPAEHALLARLASSAGGDAGGRRLLLGRYLVERTLGAGGGGTALLATDRYTGQQVVVKAVPLSRGARTAPAEARALMAVRHDRVVRLRDVQPVGDELFLVMEYVPGGSIADLASAGPLPPRPAVALMLDVLDALTAVHAAGIVHGDVKPANILVDAEGRAVLGDFGAARWTRTDSTQTGTGALASLSTAAPEVVRGRAATAASDVFSAAATLYFLLTGTHHVSVAGLDAFQVRQAILTSPPDLSHPRVPEPLVPVLRRALAKDPASRHASAAEMAAQLSMAAARLTERNDVAGPSGDAASADDRARPGAAGVTLRGTGAATGPRPRGRRGAAGGRPGEPSPG